MRLVDHLAQDPEPLPPWISGPDVGTLDPERIFESRVVYYPGYGDDGHPVALYNRAHAAHAFVLVDYAHSIDQVRSSLFGGRGFKGYTPELVREVPWSVLASGRPQPRPLGFLGRPGAAPFALLAVLRRMPGFDDAHGATRFVCLFAGVDGISAYPTLFGGRCRPHAILLQDHGFGGNYDRFGGGGLLEKLARAHDLVPRELVVAGNTTPWSGFTPVPDVDSESVGWWGHQRSLFRKEAP